MSLFHEKAPRSSFPGKGTGSLAPPAAPARTEEEPAPPPPPGCPHLAGGGRVGFGRSRRSGSARTPGCALVARAAALAGPAGVAGGSGGERVGTRAQGGVSEWEGQQKLKQRSAGAGSRGGGGESGGRGRGAEQRGLGHRTEPAPSAGPFLTGRPRAFSAGRREQASSVQVSRWGNRGRGRGHTRGGSGHHPTDPLSPLGGERGLGQDTGCKDSGR